MTCGSVWPVGVLSQSVTRGLFPGLCNLVLQVLGVVGLIYDMWLILTCWCIVPICDMWLISWSVWSFVTSYWCSLPNLWHVALCDLLVYFPNPWPVQDLMVYLVKYMTCGSLWTCFYNHTKVWRVTCCDFVFYSYICWTHGSLWALGVYLKQYKIGLFFFKTMLSSQVVQSGVQSPRRTSPLHVISPDSNTYKTPPIT